MVGLKNTIWLMFVVLYSACNSDTNYQEKGSEPAESALVEEISEHKPEAGFEEPSDTLFLDGPGVVFFMPNALDLDKWAPDASTLEGLESAVGNFAFNASVVADSLSNHGIEVHFTDRNVIVQAYDQQQHLIVRDHSSALMGLSMSDGHQPPITLYGLQDPTSWWGELEDYYFVQPETITPLLQYFKPKSSKRLHIYTSHSEILNQTGSKIQTYWHKVLSEKLARRASKFRMSFFGYYQFPLGDSLTALICRVPSISDESAIYLFVWDQARKEVIQELQLAENIWSDGLIKVKDSWISPGPGTDEYQIVQRQREARFEKGERVERDQMRLWVWSQGTLQSRSAATLAKSNYQLKDWTSFQEHQTKPIPAHLTIVDDEFAWLPLQTGDMTYEHIILELPKPYDIQKEPIANQYHSNQIDTIFTLNRPQTTFRFYGTPEEHILISGSTQEVGLAFKNGIQIGMLKNDFVDTFEKLAQRQDIPDEIRITSRSKDRIITCYFQSDTLSKLEITHYIH